MMRFNFLDERPLLGNLFRREFEPKWQSVTIAALSMVVLLASCYVLGAIRLRSAMVLNARAQGRLQSSQQALARVQMARSDLRTSIERAAKLRALRLSGSSSVLRLARIGDELANDVWLTSFSDGDFSFEVRGGTTRLAEVAPAFESIAGKGVASLTVSVSREHLDRDLEFDVRLSKHQ